MNKHSENTLEQDALQIPPDERLRLAAKLLASVPDSHRPALSKEEALELAEKRAEELDNGDVEGLNYREEMKRIRESLTG